MTDRYCPVPWYEVHINADGSYHSCGAQPNYVTGTPFGNKHNIKVMSIPMWMNSQHQKLARMGKRNGDWNPLCTMCYREDELGKSSKRKREVEKFDKPFESLEVSDLPQSYHISIGNECNLACRMCMPSWSSRIAAEQRRTGEYTGPVKYSWMDDPQAWKNFTDSVLNCDLRAIHIIGGEPLIIPRFEELIDLLIDNGKTNCYMGFTTNGTVFNNKLMEKLSVFRHTDIGVSVEATDVLNDFIRTGSDTPTILANLEKFIEYRSEGRFYVTLRAVPSALSVPGLFELFTWCMDRKLDVMTNTLHHPEYMTIETLPSDVKQRLLEKYNAWKFNPNPRSGNDRDPNLYWEHIDGEIASIIQQLQQPNNPDNTKKLYNIMATYPKWDQAKKYFTSREV